MVTSRRTTQYLRALLNKESAVQRSEEHPSLPPESAQLIRLLARLKQPERILEIGTNIGGSRNRASFSRVWSAALYY